MVAPAGIRSLSDDDSLRIANQAVEQWRRIMAALSPIVGMHGVGALYQRTVSLTTSHHPWMDVPAVSDTVDLEHLRAMLARREPAEAARCRDDLVDTFITLLSSLIGPTLVERLLPDGLSITSAGPAVQDPNP